MYPRKIRVKRFIPKDGINPNVNKPYLNMESKLNEYFKKYDNKVPVVVSINDKDDTILDPMFLFIDPERIIGNAIGFDDTHFDIEFTNAHYRYLLDDIDKCRIDIVSMVSTKKKDKDKGSIVVNRIVKIIIRKTGVSV